MHKISSVASIGLLLVCFIAVPPLNADWIPDGIPICTADSDQGDPQMIPDGTGGAIMTWEDFRHPTADIYAQRVDADGAVCWTEDGVPICMTSVAQYDPQLAPDGAGGAIITWEDMRGGNYNIYSQRVDASGAALWTANGVAICTATGAQIDPAILSDGAGGAIICWRDQRDSYNRLYAQRVNADGGALWTADGVLLCSTSTAQWYAELATDGSHGAIVTWMDQRSSSYDVYAQRIDASGTVRWAAGGLAISTARYDQTDPQIAFDGAGGVVIAWSDGRGLTGSPPPDVYAQRVDTLGSIMWTADGIVISGGYRGQGRPQIVADGEGGTVIAYQDLRNDNMDIYVQRCNANGAAMWGSGVAACTAAESQEVPMIAPDGTGGGVVTWLDYRNTTDYDIYAQRVDGSGTVRWALNGVPVCAVASTQDQVQVVSDGESGAIFVWRDRRNLAADIFATGLTEFGTGVETLLPPAHLAQNVPNPFNPATRIVFTLEAPAAVSLRIYDATGRLVRVLAESDRAAGRYEELWDGRNASGVAASSGIYFCSLSAGSFSQTIKMILLR